MASDDLPAKTVAELRDALAPLLVSAAEKVQAFARLLGVTDAAFVDAIVQALGELSLQEAYDALYAQAVRERTALDVLYADPLPPWKLQE